MVIIKQVLERRAPHYLREYRTLLKTLRKRHGDGEIALQKAVGGNYEGEGETQAALVRSVAPEGPFNLLDIGCGAGRAAYGLRNEKRVTYVGADILPELLAYARQKVGRPDWRFEPVTELAAPVDNAWADIVLFMSVFTHLKPAEIKTYLAEAARVTKPGGAVIISYLDRNREDHRALFQPAPLQRLARFLGRDVMLTFTYEDELRGWLEESGFRAEKTITYDTPRQHTMIGRRENG